MILKKITKKSENVFFNLGRPNTSTPSLLHVRFCRFLLTISGAQTVKVSQHLCQRVCDFWGNLTIADFKQLVTTFKDTQWNFLPNQRMSRINILIGATFMSSVLGHLIKWSYATPWITLKRMFTRVIFTIVWLYKHVYFWVNEPWTLRLCDLWQKTNTEIVLWINV